MMSLWKIIRNLSAIAGFILLLGTAGTTDYYANELRQAAPSYCDRNLIIGLVLILPMIIHLLVEMHKEGKQDDTK